MSPGSRPAAGALAAVLAAGAWAAWVPLGGELRIDFDNDWRSATAGFRRIPGSDDLSGGRTALVHFHGLDGRAGRLRLDIRAAPGVERVTLELRPNGGAALGGAAGQSGTLMEVAVPAGTRDLDVEVAAQAHGDDAGHGRPFVLVAATLVREAGWDQALRRALPLLAGLAALGFFRVRVGAPLAAAWGVLACLGTAAGLVTALDPAGLLAWRDGHRAGAHVLFLGALGAAAAAGAGRSRAAPALGVAGVAIGLHLPTLHHGLVYDDFLWARPWSLAEVASTFWGSEDPLGVSSTHYRPLPSVSHALDYLAWGFRPEAYRATNLLLLAAVGLLALALLRRLGAPREAALCGGLVLVAHPISASVAGWISERTDALVLGFALAALGALRSRAGARPFSVLPLALLAVWSKENAVMLPALGALLLWASPPPEGLRSRGRTLLLMSLLAAAYVAAWVSLFPEKALARAEDAGEFRGFDASRPGDWLRLVPGLYGPLLLPTDWESWRSTPLREEPALRLLGAGLLGPALLLMLGRCRDCRSGAARLALAGLLWAPLVLAPSLGLRRLDLYRIGLTPAFGAALVAAALAWHVRHRARRVLPLLAAALVAALSVPARATAAEWGPGGFYYEAVLGFNEEMPAWLAVLRPEARAQFERQRRQRDHAAHADALTRGGLP